LRQSDARLRHHQRGRSFAVVGLRAWGILRSSDLERGPLERVCGNQTHAFVSISVGDLSPSLACARGVSCAALILSVGVRGMFAAIRPHAFVSISVGDLSPSLACARGVSCAALILSVVGLRGMFAAIFETPRLRHHQRGRSFAVVGLRAWGILRSSDLERGACLRQSDPTLS
jgi:hypothetical protein